MSMLCFVFFFSLTGDKMATIGVMRQKSNVHVFGLGHSVKNLQSFPLATLCLLTYLPPPLFLRLRMQQFHVQNMVIFTERRNGFSFCSSLDLHKKVVFWMAPIHLELKYGVDNSYFFSASQVDFEQKWTIVTWLEKRFGDELMMAKSASCVELCSHFPLLYEINSEFTSEDDDI